MTYIVEELIKQIKRRLKLSRRVKIEFDDLTLANLVSHSLNTTYIGNVIIEGSKYKIKFHKYIQNGGEKIDLDYVMLNEGKQIKEAFENYEYYPSTNKEELMMDFFLISSLLYPQDENLAYSLIEVKKKFLPWMKNNMLHAVEFAICAEFRHLFDQNDSDSILNFFRKQKDGEGFIRSYALYWGSLKSQANLADLIDVDRVRKEFKSSSKSYKQSYRAMKGTKISDEQFIILAKAAFTGLRWSASYGGEAWANIADAWLKLNKAISDKDIITYVDHIYDLQHNTGTVLNKVEAYYGDDEYKWIKKALDYKLNTESLYDIFSLASPDLQKFAAAVIKSSNGIGGETVESWLKSGGKLETYKEKSANDFYPGDFVKYTGSRKDLQGLTGRVRKTDKGSVQVEFERLVEAHTEKIILNVLPKYLERVKVEEPIKKEVEDKFKVGDKVKIIQSGYNTDFSDIGKITTITEVGGKYSSWDGVKLDVTNLLNKSTNWVGVPALELVQQEKVEKEQFKPGDIVKCINAEGKKYLTLGKEYNIQNTYPKSGLVLVLADDNNTHEYKARRFEKVNKEEPKQEFKVGDIVRVISGVYSITGPGSEGIVIKNKEYNGKGIRVKFYKTVGDKNYTVNDEFIIDAGDLILLEKEEVSKGKFKIGNRVKIINPGLTYPNYEDMASEMGLKNWGKGIGSSSLGNNSIGIIIVVEPHLDDANDFLYGIKLEETFIDAYNIGKEVIVGENGLELVNNNKELPSKREYDKNRFKVGDIVKVVKKLKPLGDFIWTPMMDATIGKEGKIDNINLSGNIEVIFSDEINWKGWLYNPASLEKVNKEEPKTEFKVGDKVKYVGGMTPYIKGKEGIVEDITRDNNEIMLYVNWGTEKIEVKAKNVIKVNKSEENKNEFKIGDKVTPVKEKPVDGDNSPYWIPKMDDYINKEGTIIDTVAWIVVKFNDGYTSNYKPSWLTKVEEK
jgi:transcription antitermination factor NusG